MINNIRLLPVIVLIFLIHPETARADQSESAGEIEGMMAHVLIRSIGPIFVPPTVHRSVYDWVSAMLAIGDADTGNDDDALKQLKRLNTPESIVSLARERHFAISDSVRQEVDVIRKNNTFIASPISFLGSIEGNDAEYRRPHVYRLHIAGGKTGVVQIEEIPYHKLSPINAEQAMLPRDLYDLMDQSDSIIEEYENAYEARDAGRIEALMTEDASAWSVTIIPAANQAATSAESGAGSTVRVIGSRVKEQDLSQYHKNLSRIFSYYDSITIDIEKSSKRLYRHVAEDGTATDVLEFYQEFSGWKWNRVVYQDAGYTTLFLKTVREGEEDGRKVVRKFWSLTGTVAHNESVPFIPDDPQVIPIASNLMRDK